MQLDLQEIDQLLMQAIQEDIGCGDITSELVIPKDLQTKLQVTARQPLRVCGLPIAERLCENTAKLSCSAIVAEGADVAADTPIMLIEGDARAVLRIERTLLNILQFLSGVATFTQRYVKQISHTKAQLLDTRKTFPGLRHWQKYAVHIGGGINHRTGLYDGILIKDNHIHVAGSITAAVKKAREKAESWCQEHQVTALMPHLAAQIPHPIRIEVECDTLEQLEEALSARADIVLLDNMSIADLRIGVAMAQGKAVLEASGGVTLDTIRDIAETGVDYISVGAITHSAPAVDIGLDSVA